MFTLLPVARFTAIWKRTSLSPTHSLCAARINARLGERTMIERELVNPAAFPAPARNSQVDLSSATDATAAGESAATGTTQTPTKISKAIATRASWLAPLALRRNYRTNGRSFGKTRRTTCVFVAVGATVLAGGALVPAATAAPSSATVVRGEAGQWFLAPSLAALRAEIDAAWPGRSRASDGSIGDARHQASDNGHNPVGHPNGPGNGTSGAVHALDITASGIDVNAVLRAVIGDHRVHYVIHDGTIWSTTTGWAAKVHAGDPHYSHIHISLRDASPGGAVAAENDTSRWLSRSTRATRSLGRISKARSATPTGLGRPQVRALQRALIARGFPISAGATGRYGPATTAAVAAFQQAQGWTGSAADGVAGQQTLALLGVTGPSASKSQGSSQNQGLLPGARGTAVRQLQSALISRGYAIDAGATGFFGPATQAAVAAFQQAQGWSGSQADGVPGPMTLALLGL